MRKKGVPRAKKMADGTALFYVESTYSEQIKQEELPLSREFY